MWQATDLSQSSNRIRENAILSPRFYLPLEAGSPEKVVATYWWGILWDIVQTPEIKVYSEVTGHSNFL